MRGIVFLDRDGTLIEEVGYLRDPAELRPLPGAAEALRRLVSAGYRIAVISNQAGLARGKFTAREMESVHREFVAAFLREGVVFDAVEYCPHHPEGVVESYRETCECRKPGTGMADRVLRRLGVPDACPRWVVGDKMTDILMGVRLGARTILVGTGYGDRERLEGERHGIAPGSFLPGMREAADRILSVDGVSQGRGEFPPGGFPGPAGRGRSMDRELLEILACPKCKGELRLTADETELRCEACRLSYRVDDGIPILLIDEASPYE